MIVLVGAVSTALVSLNEMATLVDRTGTDLTRQTLDAAIRSTVRHMGNTVGDYAAWDDAARHLYGEPDAVFVDENLAGSTAEPVFFDTVYLLDASGETILAFRDGAPVELAPGAAFGPTLKAMIAELPSDGRTFDQRSAVVDGGWGLAVAAVAPVVPVSPDVKVSGPVRFLAIGKRFDQATFDAIGEDYVIRGLRIGQSGVNGVAVTDFNGETIAWLNWTPRNLGTQAQGVTQPQVLMMMLLLAFLVMTLIAVAVHGIYRLKQKEEEASHAARHDMLTGLPNRAELTSRLAAGIAAYGGGGTPVALVYLDLDGFKEVNDTYGHAIGDQLLVKVASAFERICGGRLVVRLGGDEFAVLVREHNPTGEAAAMAGRMVGYFHQRTEIDGRLVSLSASVGVVTVDEIGISVDEVMRRADVAMYRAKHLGRDRICFFEPELDAARIRRAELAAELGRALNQGALSVVYQPIFDVRSMRVTAAEALLRWPEAPTATDPSEFVAIAEETGLIEELGLWVLRQACRDALTWTDIKVAVNVSPAQFRNPAFAGSVAEILREVGLPPQRLEMEITETIVVAEPEHAASVIQALRRLGVSIALDDFGTGFSSIGYLRRFGFDKVKIDRSLVTRIDTDPQSQALVQATVHIGRALGLTVTAEGVETEAEAILMRTAGCHEVQGFHFARPESAAAIAERLGSSPALARVS